MLLVSVLAAMLVCPSRGSCDDRHYEFRVRDAATAIKIAKVAFEQEFGAVELGKLKYFEASLQGDRWIVVGHPYKRGDMPSHGGSFDFAIAAKGGCVLDMRAEM
jgi:hypothetical protein